MGIATAQPAAWNGLSTDPLAVNVEGVYLPTAGKINCITSTALTELGTVTVGTSGETYWEFNNSALQDAAMSDFGAGPITLVALFESSSSTAGQYVVAVSNPSTDHWHGITYEGNVGPQIASRGSATTSAQLAASTRFTNSLLSASVRSATDREIYDDGGSSVTNTTSVTMSGAVTTVVLGGLLRAGTVGQRVVDAGRMRIAYVIRGSLSDTEHATLAANPWRLLDDGAASGPVLSSTTTTSVTSTTATVGCTTDTGSGTLWAVVTTSATQPSISQIKAGQDHTGAAAVFASSQSIGSIGAKTSAATGLTASTAYYHHWVQNAAATDSNRLSSASFTTLAPGAAYTALDITEPVAGQPTTILVPAGYSSGTPTDLVIYCHGRGEAQTNIYNAADSKAATINAVTGAGIFVACSLATSAGVGATSWGNPGSVEAVVQLERYMRATYNIRRLVLWGDSMGGVLALNVIASGRIAVHGFLGHAPVCNLADLRAGAYGSEIDTAYAVGASPATYANKTYGYDPVLRRAFELNHMPVLMSASASDTTVSKANNADTLAALLAGTVRSVTVATATGGHIDASHFDATRDLAFIEECLDTPVALGRPTTTRTISVILKTKAGALRTGLSGLSWAWFDQPTVQGLQYPTAKGTGATTHGTTAALSVTSVPSDLAVSAPGLILVTDSNGTTTQIPIYKIGGGPVAVS